MRFITILPVMLLTAFAANAEIAIEGAFAHPPIGQSNVGIAYMTIHNKGEQNRQLIAASAKGVDNVELHDHFMDGDMMQMRKVDAIVLPAGQAVALEQGGLHLMLIGVNAPMPIGESLEIVFTLDNGETMTSAVPILARGAKLSPDDHDHSHHHHH